MANEPERLSLGRDGHPGDSDYEGLLANYVDRLLDGEEFDHERVLEEHPEVGQQLVNDLQSFIDPAAISPAEPLGTLGDYTLRRQIGRGGMGVVYEAWENSMDRRVALKVLPAGIAADNKAFHRFMREAKAAGQLAHQNVVPVFSMGVKEQTPYYAMEYVEGETLGQVLGKIREAEPEAETVFGRKDGAGYFENLVRAFADVADGLQHAHSKGVIHRDIKPSNLILDSEGRLRILDFGLAHLEGQESLTLSGDVIGTPSYMSPEQARAKKEPIDHRTDVYSLGATMYEALTRKPPFKGNSHHDTLSQIIEADPVELRKVNPRIPIDLETIVLKCLRKDAADRYGTAEALGQDLKRFVRGDPVEARPESQWERLFRRAWKARLRLGAALVFGVLLIALAFLALSYQQRVSERLESEYRELVTSAVGSIQLGLLGEPLVETSDSHKYRQILYLIGETASGSPGGGRVNDTLDDLEEAMARDPARPEAPYHRARALWLLRKVEAAYALIDATLRTHRDFAPARSLHAILERERKGEEITADEFGQLEVADGDALAKLWFEAQWALARRDWEGAIGAYGELLVLEDRGEEFFIGASLEILLAHGLASLKVERFEAAKRSFFSASDRWPEAPVPAYLLGHTYVVEGRHPEEASAWFERYVKITRLGDQELLEFILDTKNKNPETVIRFLDALPSSRSRDRALMAVLLFAGRARAALDLCIETVGEEPEEPFDRAFLAWIHAEIPGNRLKARRWIKSAVESGSHRARLCYTVAQAFGSLCDWQEMERWSEAAMQLSPGELWPRASLAEAAFHQGKLELAQDLLVDSREGSVQDPSLFSALDAFRIRTFLDSSRRSQTTPFVETQTIPLRFTVTGYAEGHVEDFALSRPVPIEAVSFVTLDGLFMRWHRGTARGLDQVLVEALLLSDGHPVASALVDRVRTRREQPIFWRRTFFVGAREGIAADALRLRVSVSCLKGQRSLRELTFRGAYEEDSIRLHFVHGAFRDALPGGRHERLTFRQVGPKLEQQGPGVTDWTELKFHRPVSADHLALVALSDPFIKWKDCGNDCAFVLENRLLAEGESGRWELPLDGLPPALVEAGLRDVMFVTNDFSLLDGETRAKLSGHEIVGWRSRLRVEGSGHVWCEYNHSIWAPLEFLFAYDMRAADARGSGSK